LQRTASSSMSEIVSMIWRDSRKVAAPGYARAALQRGSVYPSHCPCVDSTSVWPATAIHRTLPLKIACQRTAGRAGPVSKTVGEGSASTRPT
jgi:hypothetical protein